MSDFEDIADALANPEHQDTALARITLRYAVQRVIFSPYGGGLLDVRRAVLLDGTDHGGKADVMTADEYDLVLERSGGLEKLQEKLGYELQIYDGRELFR